MESSYHIVFQITTIERFFIFILSNVADEEKKKKLVQSHRNKKIIAEKINHTHQELFSDFNRKNNECSLTQIHS